MQPDRWHEINTQGNYIAHSCELLVASLGTSGRFN